MLQKCSEQIKLVIRLEHLSFSAGFLGLSRITVLAVLMVGFMSQSQAAQLRIAHCLYGCPVGSSSESHLILRPIYALSYNTHNKVADWAAYRVTSGSIGIASSLSRAAMIDDFVGTPYWNEVNYLSNAVARSRNLSLGAWYGLEWSIRNLVNRESEVYILTGPIFRETPVAASLETQARHRVPDAFFKIVVSADNRATAIIFDQDLPVHVHHCDSRTTIDEIEKATGLEFFSENPRLVSGLLDASLGCI